MPAKKNAPSTPPPRTASAGETVTCRHCRYERPAQDKHCHICGYPWDWAKETKRGAKQ